MYTNSVNGSNLTASESYTYSTDNNYGESTQVKIYTSAVGTNSQSYTYTYDDNGYITKIRYSSGKTIEYTYNDLGWLIEEDNDITYKIYTYSYNNAGNIVRITETEKTQDDGFIQMGVVGGSDAELLALKPNLPSLPLVTTYTCSYNDSEWGDLLASFNGTTITYDEIGNPLSYYNGSSYTFTWDGRRLATAVKGSNSMSFTYNDDGLRVTKTVNGIVTAYYYQGSLLVAEETNSQILVYIYDANGAPVGFKYRGVNYASGTWDTYAYEKNLQGDIVAVYDTATGNKLIAYKYNAWGVCTTSYYNSGSTTTATKNPFKYRGYYYDSNLGLYYLQSRYYDPNTGRFINADGALYHSMLGYNMFAYCENNPVNYYDPTGEDGEVAICLPMIAVGMPLVDGPLPIGDILAFGIILYMILAATKSKVPPEPKVNDEEPPDISPESGDAEEIGDDADSLPNQGNVTIVPDAPPVEAGKQGKHVLGHNNNKPDKTAWQPGENGVRQTQEAWKNSKPHPSKPNTRVGVSNDGRTIEIKFSKTGIHGYPIFVYGGI